MGRTALIISGGWDGHEPALTSEIFRRELTAVGLTVAVATSLDALLAPNLATFDLIVPNWTMGTLTTEQENALVTVVRSGVGLGGFHGGMGDAFRANTDYQFMTGGQFVAHPDNQREYTVHIVKPEDPIVAGIGDFTFRSEQYYMHVDPSNEVLAESVFQTASAPWVNGTVMPAVWKRRFGAGRVFYSSLGHNAAEFGSPPVREITKRGLLWAAR